MTAIDREALLAAVEGLPGWVPMTFLAPGMNAEYWNTVVALRAVLDLIAAAPPVPLDVERLARALEATAVKPPDVHHMAVDWRTTEERADAIAREYEAQR